MPNTSADPVVVRRDAERPGVPRSTLFAAAGVRLGKSGVVLVLAASMVFFGFLWLKILVPYTPIVPIPCPFEALTGYDCPGCGLQSSLTNLFELKWKYVLMANLLSPVLLPLFFILVISWAADTLFAVTLWRFDFPRWAIILAVIVVIAYGIARNIPSLGVW